VDRGTVLIVGAGPAGLYATRKIATAGHQVLILNRDIKPGGLAEYGIYPEKHHMKQGLRKQFWKILEMPNVAYLGNLPVRDGGTLTIDQLRQLNPSACVFAVGAQGTKKLGMPGEEAKGVYSAKDFVYHYNQLPPFASQDFSTGRRVAIVGMGNVMVDIARWLLIDMPGQKPEEVVVVARRGPFEVKFDEKEFDHIEMYLDRPGFQEELRRVAERISACGQDASKVPEKVFPWLNRSAGVSGGSKLSFRFLTSPVAIVPGASGRIAKLRVVENLLVLDGQTTKAKATDQTLDLEFDTLIFAIGDVVDPTLGLPYEKGGYLTRPGAPETEAGAYEVFDPKTGRALEGHYVVGWARKASEGLVGKARYDAEHGCDHILKYLEGAPRKTSLTLQEILREVAPPGARLTTKEDILLLARVEEARAREAKRPAFKFSTNEEMLAAIEQQRASLRNLSASAA
jgi:ferredoxin--NADP+ reductase